MDLRLLAAVDASVRWYDDIFSMHGVPTAREDGIWWARGEPPRWHSAAKTTAPTAARARALRAVEPFEHCSIADSFGEWDLSDVGFDLLFEATWVHHPRPDDATRALPVGWSVITDEGQFETWNAKHDTAGVLLPSMLTNPRFDILAKIAEGALVGGGVIHDFGGEAVGLSNEWALPGTELDANAVLACVRKLRPGRAVVGYAWGDDLDALVGAGFTRLGPHTVWIR